MWQCSFLTLCPLEENGFFVAHLTFLVYGNHFHVFPHVALFILSPTPMRLEIHFCVPREDLMWRLFTLEYSTKWLR